MEHITVRVNIPAAHLTGDEYLGRAAQLTDALLDLEAANPGRFVDPGIAAQAGPEPSSRWVEIDAEVHVESGHVWASVPSLPGCFASGATLAELREALVEAITLWMEPTGSARDR